MKKFKVCFFCVFLFWGLSLFANEVLANFPDDLSTRKNLIPLLFSEEISSVVEFEKRTFTDETGLNWRLWVEQDETTTGYFFSPSKNGIYSANSQGTWILSRDTLTGDTKTLQIILKTNYPCFLQIEKLSDTQVSMSLVAQNAYFSQNCTLGISLQRFYELSFSQIKNMTATILNWQFADPDVVMYQNNRHVIPKIANHLKKLKYADDGCYDEENRLVSIATGEPSDDIKGVNCSGFLKWVVDSMVYPVIGQGLFVNPLKTPTVALTEEDLKDNPTALYSASNYSRDYISERDPFFGLDWTRNLAAAAASVFCNRNLTPKTAGVDVIRIPFTALYDKKTNIPQLAPPYASNMGFSVRILKPLLYALAVEEPDTVYLASVNTVKLGDDGKRPLRQHYHTAVFIPTFMQDGTFKVALFESASQTNLETFIAQHKDEYIHLTRIKTPGQVYFAE